ncbi:hypothetical protein [Cellulomonas marina]|uniref:Uncharacterized protein n=1 Tax=Cellulomonas marina TaxID=988821 RepID=A0A1I0XWP7_9CELL|nr:hypothetical protein [Cellulomonas marina]GIG28482.1 hypothetical protein Cma02nite_10820 [Cellulomonas marina]SFB05569.1 hypothetical protein SAMN05421867_10638 [Cellulomonas marina]
MHDETAAAAAPPAPDPSPAPVPWADEVLGVPRRHPLRDLDAVRSVVLDLPDEGRDLLDRLVEGRRVLLVAGEPAGGEGVWRVLPPPATAGPATTPGVTPGVTPGAPPVPVDEPPGDPLEALARAAAAADRRLDGAELVLALGRLSDADDAPGWSVAAGGSRLGRTAALLLPVRLHPSPEAPDAWELRCEPGRPARRNAAAGRAVAAEHGPLAAALADPAPVPVTRLAGVLDEVLAAATPPVRATRAAELALLPLAPLEDAAALRALPLPVAGLNPRGPCPGVEVLETPAGPGGTRAVADVLVAALTAGTPVTVVAGQDADLDDLAARLDAAALGPFVLALTGRGATVGGLRDRLRSAGRPPAALLEGVTGDAAEHAALTARLARDDAAGHLPGPAGVALWDAFAAVLRLEAELPPEAVALAPALPVGDLARRPDALPALRSTVADLAEALVGGGDPDAWAAEHLAGTAEADLDRVAVAVTGLLAADRAVRATGSALADLVAAPRVLVDVAAHLELVAAWLDAGAASRPVAASACVRTVDDSWHAAASAARAALAGVRSAGRELVGPDGSVGPGALGLDLDVLDATLVATPERRWWPERDRRRRRAAVLAALAPHRRPDVALEPDDAPGLVEALLALRDAAREVVRRVAAVPGTVLPPGWQPLDDAAADALLADLDLRAATAALATAPGVGPGAVDAAVPPGPAEARAAAEAVRALAAAWSALPAALGTDLAGLARACGDRPPAAVLTHDGPRWADEVAAGLPGLRARAGLRLARAALPDEVAAVLLPDGPGGRRRARVAPEHLVGTVELAAAHAVLDERRAALDPRSSGTAVLRPAERAAVVDRLAALELAERSAARARVPLRLLAALPEEARVALADGLVADLAAAVPMRPLWAFLAGRGDDLAVLLPAVLVPLDLLGRALPLQHEDAVLVVEDAGRVPAARVAVAASRARRVLLVERTGGAPPDPASALVVLGAGASPVQDGGGPRRPELRAAGGGPAWGRHRAAVAAALVAAGLVVRDPAGPEGTVADLVVGRADGSGVAVLLDRPAPGAPAGSSSGDVALSAWLQGRDDGGSWAAVRTVTAAAWLTVPDGVVQDVDAALPPVAGSAARHTMK